jgi:predicted Rdx family selenoprotein
MNGEEAKRNKFDLQVTVNDLLNLNGKGDGFFKNNKNKQAIRIQIQPYRDL